jgi:hypothetical protein
MSLTRRIAALAASLAAVSCGAPPPTAPAPSTTTTTSRSTDPKDLAEALLVGSGPLSDAANRGCSPGRMVGWQSGSMITVRVSSQLPQTSQAQIRQVVSRIGDATLGNVNATIQMTDDVDPRPSVGEITIWGTGNPAAAGCPTNAALCTSTVPFFPPYITHARIVGLSQGNFPHELGHAVFGFCHTLNPNVFDKETIMAGAWELADRDVAMLQSVYRAGLGPGATRADLANAGIINPAP